MHDTGDSMSRAVGRGQRRILIPGIEMRFWSYVSPQLFCYTLFNAYHNSTEAQGIVLVWFDGYRPSVESYINK